MTKYRKAIDKPPSISHHREDEEFPLLGPIPCKHIYTTSTNTENQILANTGVIHV